MPNLLYKGYKRRAYVNFNDSAMSGYEFVKSMPNVASYFADLSPNTTYTISKIDSSDRFRIATFSTDVKANLFSKPRELGEQGYNIDEYTSYTFTTGENDIYLVVYYTQSSQFQTRIMLNEGSVAEAYAEPTVLLPHSGMWTVVDNKLVHDDLPDTITDNFITEPYLPFWWYVNESKLDTRDIPDAVYCGCFYGCTALKTANIPTGCVVGRDAFRGTKIIF